MRLKNSSDIGALIRDRRGRLAMTQKQLAARCGVSTRWLVDVEAGKSSAEIGLVVRLLETLGLELNAAPLPPRTGVDLDAVLDAVDHPSPRDRRRTADDLDG